jgi:subtilisin-like proprotein convertase family protein
VALSLDIRHPFRGDLRVVLTSPKGTTFLIHDREGGSADDLLLTSFPLPSAEGESIAGDWTLTVSDEAALDTGTLKTWSLSFTSCAP